MIGIIGAMDEEVNELKKLLTDETVITKAGMSFHKGILYNKDVVIVRSGIGKVNAGICAQILVDLFDVSAIINTGIAGSLNADIDICDIVLSSDALQHDMDAVAFGYKPGVIPRMDTSVFKGDERLISLAGQSIHNINPDLNVFEGRVVTGDQFISSHEKKQWLVQMFNGDCTEMEGAAIAQAAHLNNVPFIIIRAISDKADNSASMDYPEFEAKAINNSVMLLCEMIKNWDNF